MTRDRNARLIVGLVAATLMVGCASASKDLTLRTSAQRIPTKIGRTPADVTVAPGSVTCLVATVAGSEHGYSVVIDEHGYLSPVGSKLDHVVSYVTVFTVSGAYRGAFGWVSIDYEHPAVSIEPNGISGSGGGFGGVDREYPIPLTISRKLLMAGQDHDYDHNPALTMVLPSPPTSCRIDVVGGFPLNGPGVQAQIR
jgi:hypothetical protein